MSDKRLEEALKNTDELPEEWFGEEELTKEELVELEELAKKCPRCGGASANSSNPSGRCSACLKKLAHNKKKPGHWQRAQTKADDALRRQKGKNGTAHKKSSGLGNRKSIVKQTQSAEKKTGQKLSPDRKNNSKGYASSNTRMVPEKLNRGRHHVDEKKLRNWKKKLKKSEIDTASLYTLMKAKFHDDPEALELIKTIGPSGLEMYIDLFGEQLEKSAAKKLEPVQPAQPSIHSEIGKTHTVEIHPDIDHLYRAKGLIKDNNRPHLHIGDFKRHGFPKDIIKKLPHDAHGKVTPDMIDKHIEGLPKHKVNIKIHPYTWQAQQHRQHNIDPSSGSSSQYVATMHLHPEHHNKADKDVKEVWDDISRVQHQFHNADGVGGATDQVGWARLDPHKKTNGQTKPNDDHWHIDEIQSDFQHKDKIDAKLPKHGSEHYKPSDVDRMRSKAQDLHDHLSHGHEDPQHAIHSAVNALGRKLGVKSMSMDTPEDQAKQSHLRNDQDDIHDDARQDYVNDRVDHHRGNIHKQTWGNQEGFFSDLVENHNNNPNFKAALEKVGGINALKSAGKDGLDLDDTISNYQSDKENPELVAAYDKLSTPEQDALHGFMREYNDWIHDKAYSKAEDDADADLPPSDRRSELKDKPSFDLADVPIHQLDTYHKRPKRLGMKQVPKEDVLGHDDKDKASHVQYMKLHKKLETILELLKKSYK